MEKSPTIKQFDISISEKDEVLYVKVNAPLDDELGVSFTKEYVELGNEQNIYRCLIDLRETSVVASPVDEYVFAYKKRKSLGLDFKWKIAILKKENDDSVCFFETVMQNNNIPIKSFSNERNALSYLNDYLN